MSTLRSEKTQNRIDWTITIAGLALIVLICVGFYMHTHPTIEKSPEKQPQTTEYTL